MESKKFDVMRIFQDHFTSFNVQHKVEFDVYFTDKLILETMKEVRHEFQEVFYIFT